MSIRAVAAIIGGVVLAAAGVAVAADLLSNGDTDFLKPGTHQFYVWCAGAHDYVASAQGANAEDAQMKLYDEAKAKGHSSCWPVWQARIAS